MTTLGLKPSIDRSPLRPVFFLISLLLGCVALSPVAHAKPHPHPTPPGEDRGNGNTAAENVQALDSNTTGINNTATGRQSLFSNTEGNENTANGYQALFSNTTGLNNAASGVSALYSNTTGMGNTANGSFTLHSNTTGDFNTATGAGALLSNTTGDDNTASGRAALSNNTTGAWNTAVGTFALYTNTSGSENTANGALALQWNTTGDANTANGIGALTNNTTGSRNTANGLVALQTNTTGSGNTADGDRALWNNATGSNNIALGSLAGSNLSTGDYNIDIGNPGVAAEANTIRIGNEGNQAATFIAGITGTAVVGNPVTVDGNGQLGVVVSSERFKDQIKPMDKASEAILALKPVTFHYKKEMDREAIPRFGLLAEDVEKVNPDLVTRDSHGKVYTVRYDAVNAMLLNEFLKEHKKVDAQQATIIQLKSTLAQQQKDFQASAAHQQEQIDALTAGLQRVSDQLERRKPAPQMTLNNQ